MISKDAKEFAEDFSEFVFALKQQAMMKKALECDSDEESEVILKQSMRNCFVHLVAKYGKKSIAAQACGAMSAAFVAAYEHADSETKNKMLESFINTFNIIAKISDNCGDEDDE